MRKLLLTAPLLVTSALYACDDTTNGEAPGVPDASVPDAPVGTPPSAEAGPGTDAGAGDASPPDAGTVDAGPEAGVDGGALNALFGHIDGKLLRIDPVTGAFTEVGATGQPWIVLAWDDVAKVARVVLDVYSPNGGDGTPKLGTLDPCNGLVTPGPALTLGGVQVRRAEGLAQNPADGSWRITFGTTGTGAASQFLSEKNGTVDVTTGAVTLVGSHVTLQNDGDGLLYVGGTLRLLDIAAATNAGSLYLLDPATGATSAPLSVGPTARRLAYDPTRDVVFTTNGTGEDPNVTNRSAGRLNLTTGQTTSLGTPLAAGAYGGRHFDGLVSMPAPVCPPPPL